MRPRQILALCMVLFIAGFAWIPAQAQDTETLHIHDVQIHESSADITLSYRDSQGAAISDFDAFEVTVGGTPITRNIPVSPLRIPIAVAIIADLSAPMSYDCFPFTSCFDSMKQLLEEELLPQLQLPTESAPQQVKLIPFTETVLSVDCTEHDIQCLLNTVSGQSEAGSFRPSEQQPTLSPDPYPIQEAIEQGVGFLEQQDMPGVLLVLAAGAPDMQLDSAALQNETDYPLTVHVFAFGSIQPEHADGITQSHTTLDQFAQDNGGTFLQISAPGVIEQEATLAAINTQFERVLAPSKGYTLQVPIDPAMLQPGTEIHIRAGDTEAMYELRQEDIAQNGEADLPTESVPATPTPTEALADGTDVEATDTTGANTTTPTNTGSGLPWLAIIGAFVVVGVGAGAFFFLRMRRQSPKTPAWHFEGPGDDEATQEVTPISDDDEATQEAVPTNRTTRQRLCVVVLEGGDDQAMVRFELDDQERRYYDIGRPSKQTKPQIPLEHRKVSREHAGLAILANGDIELTAYESQNGTFLGEERQKMAPGEKARLMLGDVFWISEDFKLQLQQTNEDEDDEDPEKTQI